MSLITDVEIQLNQPNGAVGDPGSAWWSQQQIIDAINVSLLDTWGLIRYAYTTSTITTTASQAITGFDSTTIMIPQYILNTGQYLWPTTFALLQDWSANYRNNVFATPQWFVQWDAQNLYLWPTPDQTYTFVLYGVPWPPLISGTASDIAGLDPHLRNVIIHRASAYLLEETQSQLADNFDREATEHERRFWKQVRNMQGHNTFRLAPTRGWTGAQTGDITLGRRFSPSNNTFS